MSNEVERPLRLTAIDTLPIDMRDFALVDWPTVASIIGSKDVQYARETITKAGIPLVHVSERRRLPRWGALRAFLLAREQAAET